MTHAHDIIININERKVPIELSRWVWRRCTTVALKSPWNITATSEVLMHFTFFCFTGNCCAEFLALIRLSLKSPTMASQGSNFEGSVPHAFVTMGASVRRLTKMEHLMWIFKCSCSHILNFIFHYLFHPCTFETWCWNWSWITGF